MMRTCLIVITSLFLCTSLSAQDRFFEFVPGWTNIHIEETENGYLSLGLGTVDDIPGNNHTFITARINNFGETIDYTSTILDSTYLISLRINQENVITIGNEKIVVGLKAYAEYQAYGLLVWYNEDMSEVNNFRTYDLGWNARFSTVNYPNDSTILVGGYISTQNNPVWTDPILLNLDLEGNIRWQVNYHCGNSCKGYMKQVLETNDGGYLIVTEHQEYVDIATRGSYYEYKKITSDGEIQWTYTPGDYENMKYFSAGAVQLDDDNILIMYSDAMFYNSIGWDWNDNTNLYFEILDNDSGVIQFSQTLTDPIAEALKPINMVKTQDGNVVVSGWLGGYNNLMKLTLSGEIIWSRDYLLYPGTIRNIPFGLIETSDEGFLLCGELHAFDGPDFIQSAYVFKTDEYGCWEEGCQGTDNISENELPYPVFIIYPNPSTGRFTITTTQSSEGQIIIKDLLGRLILTQPINQQIAIDISNHPKGVYLVEYINDEGLVYVEKVVLE